MEPGRTGLHHRPGDAAGLAESLAWAEAHPRELATMGEAARAVHAQCYAPEAAHRSLLEIYAEARALTTRATAGV